jgi:hypothetical protein
MVMVTEWEFGLMLGEGLLTRGYSETIWDCWLLADLVQDQLRLLRERARRRKRPAPGFWARGTRPQTPAVPRGRRTFRLVA